MKALAVAIDIRDADAVDTAFGEVEGALGPVEMLVNNAGITRDGLLARMSDEQWSDVVDTNLGGAFHTIRRATPKMMRARFGRIVNISSVSGHIGAPGQANYSAAKAGLLGLSRAVARELASRDITCNVVAPGPIVTAMTDAMPAEWRQAMEATVPAGPARHPRGRRRGGRLPLLRRRRLRHRGPRSRRRRPRHGTLIASPSRPEPARPDRRPPADSRTTPQGATDGA